MVSAIDCLFSFSENIISLCNGLISLRKVARMLLSLTIIEKIVDSFDPNRCLVYNQRPPHF
ncbi:hypothetical protein YEEN111655_03640 [Yersinia entomophaga]